VVSCGLLAASRPESVEKDRKPSHRDRGGIEDWNNLLPKPYDDIHVRKWNGMRQELERDGVLIVRHSFSPWNIDREYHSGESELLVQRERDQGPDPFEPVSKVSSLTASLPAAWRRDIQVHAFALLSSRLGSEEVLDRISAWPEHDLVGGGGEGRNRTMTGRELYRRLNGSEFRDYVELESKLLESFRAHVSEVPCSFHGRKIVGTGRAHGVDRTLPRNRISNPVLGRVVRGGMAHILA
jgi:hypothetical protein